MGARAPFDNAKQAQVAAAPRSPNIFGADQRRPAPGTLPHARAPGARAAVGARHALCRLLPHRAGVFIGPPPLILS